MGDTQRAPTRPQGTLDPRTRAWTCSFQRHVCPGTASGGACVPHGHGGRTVGCHRAWTLAPSPPPPPPQREDSTASACAHTRQMNTHTHKRTKHTFTQAQTHTQRRVHRHINSHTNTPTHAGHTDTHTGQIDTHGHRTGAHHKRTSPSLCLCLRCSLCFRLCLFLSPSSPFPSSSFPPGLALLPLARR